MHHSRSGKPLTTYSRRRPRRRDPDNHASTSQSSPIRALSPDTEEVSFAVMASRMTKRARTVAPSGAIYPDGDNAERKREEDRPLKRQKPTPSDNDGADNNGDCMRDICPDRAQLCTPRGDTPSDQSMAVSSAGRPLSLPDQLSPFPVAKRIIYRTSSRKLRENAASRPLASPFNSHPPSRASSPDKSSRGIVKGRQGYPGKSKSRTLSQSSALREKVVDRNVAVTQGLPGPQVPSTLMRSSVESGPPAKVVALAHVRSSSIPTLKPALGSIASDSWLVPPKALSRPPPAIGPDNDGDNQDMAIDSFFLDVPVHTSTPPRRQSATASDWAHGLMPQLDADPPPPIHSFRYDSDVDMSDSSLPGSPSDSTSSRVVQPRRRRRTIVHLPSDSLFSSSLDFSVLRSETQRFPRAPASEGSRSPEREPPFADSDLGPAISLGDVAHASARKSSSAGRVSLTGHTASPILPSGALHNANVLGTALSSPDIDGDELLELFSVLGLDEDEKWTADDSGVVIQDPISHAGSNSIQGVRVNRKRGDTIRASDYAKFSVLASSASLDSVSAPVGLQRAPPRRTRSGTVTQGNSSGGLKRRHEGWPTIKMRTRAEPLRADENEEDELLLKDGDVIVD